MTEEDVAIEFDEPDIDVVVWTGTPEEVTAAFVRIDACMGEAAKALSAYSDAFAALVKELVILSDGFKQVQKEG